MREAILKTVTGTIHRLKNLSSSKQSESDATDGAKLAAQKQEQDVGPVIHVSDENVGGAVQTDEEDTSRDVSGLHADPSVRV